MEGRAELGFFPNPVFQRDNLCLALLWLTSRVLRQSTRAEHASTWTKQFCFLAFLMWQEKNKAPSPPAQAAHRGPTIQTCPPSQHRCWVKYVHLWRAAGRGLVATHGKRTDSAFSSHCSGSPGVLYGTFISIILCCLLGVRDSVLCG